MYILTLIISCVYLNFMYYVLNGYGSFNNYIIKNLMKSIYLFFLFLAASIFIIPYNEYNNNVVKVFASLYVSNDLMGLIKVKLNLTTKIHHVVSCCLLLYAWTIDFNKNNIAQAIFMYTYLSAANFGVNAYLGLRFLGDFEWLRHKVTPIYLITLIINVVLQFYILDLKTDGVRLYIFFIFLIIIDDMYLLKWLCNV